MGWNQQPEKVGPYMLDIAFGYGIEYQTDHQPHVWAVDM